MENKPKFKRGDKLQVHKPGHPQNGATGVVRLVALYEAYGEKWAYIPEDYWRDGRGCVWCFTRLPESMLRLAEEGE